MNVSLGSCGHVALGSLRSVRLLRIEFGEIDRLTKRYQVGIPVRLFSGVCRFNNFRTFSEWVVDGSNDTRLELIRSVS